MGKFYVHVPRIAEKNLKRIPIPWQDRIRSVLDTLEFDPFYGIKMTGPCSGYYKVRVWPYRIIYRVKKEKQVVEILEIDHRGHMHY